jgi:hypothetical protein
MLRRQYTRPVTRRRTRDDLARGGLERFKSKYKTAAKKA